MSADDGTIAPSALAHVLEKIELGVVGLGSGEPARVIFTNEKARELLDGEVDAASLAERFELRTTRLSSASFIVGDWIRIGEKSVGYSVYEVPDGSRWIVLRDVTEKLRMQRAAEGMAVAQSLGYTFAGVAHELGNPINSVKMAATVLRDNASSFSAEKQHEYLTEILSETKRMQDILRLMQRFIGMASLEPLAGDLGAECRAFVERSGKDATAKGVVVVSAFAARGPVPARIDPPALHQVLLNLFSNALEAVATSPAPQITIDAFVGERAAHLRVSDNGRGIDAVQRERLFFPFYSTRPGKMGFGLVVVKKLVSSMGGTIEVTSAPGVGTSFEVLLPLANERVARQEEVAS